MEDYKEKVLQALTEKEEVWIKDICKKNQSCYLVVFSFGKQLEQFGIAKIVHENMRNKLVRGEYFKNYQNILEKINNGIHTI